MQEPTRKRLSLGKKILVPGQGGLRSPNAGKPVPTHGNRSRSQSRNRVKVLHLKDIRDNQRKLIQYWPQLYRNGRILPLRAGIREDMIADLEARGITVNPKRIASELFSATNTENYCRRLLFLKWRFNIQGKPAIKITDDEREHAYKKLSDRMTLRGRTPPRHGFWKNTKPPFRKRPAKKNPA